MPDSPPSSTLPGEDPAEQARFLAVVFPLLRSERLVREGLVSADLPFAVTERHRGTQRIVEPGPAAAASGIAAGQSLAEARRRVPGVQLFPEDTAADAALLERLAEGCERFTPRVALWDADAVMLAIAPGDGEIAPLAEQRFARAGLTVRAASGQTPAAAEALARYQTVPAADENGALRRLPLAALKLEAEEEEALRATGLRCIGDVADAPVAARAHADALAGLFGPPPPALPPRRPLPALAVQRAIEHAGADLRALMADAEHCLSELEAGSRRFVLRGYRRDGLAISSAVRCSMAVRAAAELWSLFDRDLAADADGWAQVDFARLEIGERVPLAPTQLLLEGGTAAAPVRTGRRPGRRPAAAPHPELALPAPATEPRAAPETPPAPALRLVSAGRSPSASPGSAAAGQGPDARADRLPARPDRSLPAPPRARRAAR